MDKKKAKLPIWLRRFDLVARQMQERGSMLATAEERIDMMLSLMG